MLHRFTFLRLHARACVFLASISSVAVLLALPLRATAANVSPDRDASVQFHTVTTLFLPELATEDVDVVPVAIPASPFPNTAMVQREGVMHWVTYGPGPMAIYASNALPSPNIPGVDGVSDGTYAISQTLGFGLVFTGLPAGAPALTGVFPLPGAIPTRYDSDPILFTSAGVTRAIYFTGNGVHCRVVAGPGGPWDVTLASVMVTACDGLLGPPSGGFPAGLLWVPSVNHLTVINPVTGGVVATYLMPSQPTREVDIQFVPGAGLAYHQRNGFLYRYVTATGALAGGAPNPLTLAGPNIEGNDAQLDPTGAALIVVTVPLLYKITAGTGAVAAAYPTAGAPIFPAGVGPAHQRNHDPIFSPTIAANKWVYMMQGYAIIGDVFPLVGAPVPFALGVPGTLVDGVDASFMDIGPLGPDAGDRRFEISTLPGLTSVIDAVALAHVPGSPISTPGGRLIDVDDKPAPLPGNSILQTTVSNLTQISGFGPADYWVPTATGGHILDMNIPAWVEFIPTAPLYRGGDPQPTLATGLGPVESAFQIDDPDQDFLPKCWEYKFAVNRVPTWWYYSQPFFYPHWVPYGLFGPPAWAGYDLLNEYKVIVLRTPQIAVLNRQGFLIHTINLISDPISGLIWDWDHKIAKIRLRNQQEAIINFNHPFGPGAPFLVYQPYGAYTRWYPVVDRINGWECTVQYGGRDVWISDHLYPSNPPFIVNLMARAIRRPVFDEQRKVVCIALANQRLAFINMHKLRQGFPIASWLYYSPVLPGHIVEQPVFDLYNHYTLAQLRGSRVVICNTDNGNLLYDTGILPYWPTGPLQVDCYNKVAKGFYRDAANFYELHLKLYPMVFGGVPVLSWITMATQPYGYPLFDSMDGYEFVQQPSRLVYNDLYNIVLAGNVPFPAPTVGAVLFDRVNKYGLVALQGNQLFWMNLHRITNGIVTPAAYHAIALPGQPGHEGVFDVTGHRAVWALTDGRFVVINMVTGQLMYTSSAVLPKFRRQFYVHPYSHLVNYTSDNGGIPVDVTIDLVPTTWSAPQPPTINVMNLPDFARELNFAPPPTPVPVEIVQLSLQSGSSPGSVDFEVDTAPGNIVQAVNQTQLNTFAQCAPSEGTADEGPLLAASGPTLNAVNGLAEVNVVANPNDVVCFTIFDSEGDASGTTCVNVGTLDVPGGGVHGQLSFALRGENPIRGTATFDFALPANGRVDLGIYDISGRLVSKLVGEELEAGEHAAMWRTKGKVSPGIYFAKIRAGVEERGMRLVVIQ